MCHAVSARNMHAGTGSSQPCALRAFAPHRQHRLRILSRRRHGPAFLLVPDGPASGLEDRTDYAEDREPARLSATAIPTARPTPLLAPLTVNPRHRSYRASPRPSRGRIGETKPPRQW